MPLVSRINSRMLHLSPPIFSMAHPLAVDDGGRKITYLHWQIVDSGFYTDIKSLPIAYSSNMPGGSRQFLEFGRSHNRRGQTQI